jgi:hypothetical protein
VIESHSKAQHQNRFFDICPNVVVQAKLNTERFKFKLMPVVHVCFGLLRFDPWIFGRQQKKTPKWLKTGGTESGRNETDEELNENGNETP